MNRYYPRRICVGAVEDNNVTSVTYRHEGVSVCVYVHIHAHACEGQKTFAIPGSAVHLVFLR